VHHKTPVKSEGFFFLLPFSFFLPDEQVFFSLARKRRKKKEKCAAALRTRFKQIIAFDCSLKSSSLLVA
jgi:hypothetical protein